MQRVSKARTFEADDIMPRFQQPATALRLPIDLMACRWLLMNEPLFTIEYSCNVFAGFAACEKPVM